MSRSGTRYSTASTCSVNAKSAKNALFRFPKTTQSTRSKEQISAANCPKNTSAFVEASNYTSSLAQNSTSLQEINRKQTSSSQEADDEQLPLLYRYNKKLLGVSKDQQDSRSLAPGIENKLSFSSGNSGQHAVLSNKQADQPSSISVPTGNAAQDPTPWEEIITNKETRLFPQYVEHLSDDKTMALKRNLDEITQENAQSKKEIRTLQQSQRRLSQRRDKIESLIRSIEQKKPVCSARNCNSISTNSELSFHKFPIHSSRLLKKWLKACNPDWAPTEWSTLCSKHFNPECFQTSMELKLLAHDAFPTIYSDDPTIVDRQDDDDGRTADFEAIHEDSEKEETIEKQEEEVNMNMICRLCAAKGTTHVPIFEDCDGVNQAVAEKISRCLPIIVLPTDELPLAVCSKCLHCLNMSYKLLVSSVRVDALLRSKLFNSRKSPSTAQSDRKKMSKSISHHDAIPSIKGIETNMESLFSTVNLDEGPIECDICMKVFGSDFYDHMESSHLLEWRCNLCAESFECSSQLLAHKKSSHNGEIVTCEDCCVCPINSIESPLPETIPNITEIETGQTTADRPIILTDNEITIFEEVTIGYEENELSQDSTSASCKPKSDESKTPREASLYPCDSCGAVFARESQLNYHKKINGTCSKASDLQCKYCNESCSSKSRLAVHLRKHKKEMLEDPTVTVYKCVTCPKIFVDKGLYQKHRNVHDPECWDKFRCSVCNRCYTDGSKLRLHQNTHQGLKPYSCEVCDRTFNRRGNMKKHWVKHFNKKCPYCKEIFEAQRPLTKHLKEYHGVQCSQKSKSKEKADFFVCKFCGKQLASYNSLLAHERIHTGDKPFACKYCSKKFRTHTGRWHHSLRHKRGNYVCEHCGKIFNTEPNFNRHLQTHVKVEERKYQCSYCGKRFYWKYHLNVHIRMHTGLRPFVCDICQFGFMQLCDLKRHRAKHCDEETRTCKREPQGRVTPEPEIPDSANSDEENVDSENQILDSKNGMMHSRDEMFDSKDEIFDSIEDIINSRDDFKDIVPDAISSECVYYEEVE